MMKRKSMIISVLLCLLPILWGVFLWNKLPDQIATHFDFNGAPNGYSSKISTILGMPCLLALVNAFVLFFVRIDPKATAQPPIMQKILLCIVPVITNFIMPAILFNAIGINIPISTIIVVLVGVLFILIGNYLPKCKLNYTMGIRLPWTLDDPENWNYTHRIAGFIWVIGGIAMVVNAFLQSQITTFIIIVLLVGLPTACSYLYYRKHK